MLSHFNVEPERGVSHSGRGSLRLSLVASFIALSVPQLAAAADGEYRVLHHQALQITRTADVGATEHVAFDAYGRRFELSVSPNERIRRAVTAGNTATMPLQGTVDGATNSWVRITRSASGMRGMIFDGHSLYAIDTAADVAGSTVEPLTVSGTAPVIYRLEDALLPTDTMSCDVTYVPGEPEAPSNAAAAFEQLSQELRSRHAMVLAQELDERFRRHGETI